MTRTLLLLSALTLAGTAYAADKKVERLFNSKCASCHGKDGTKQEMDGFKDDLKPGDLDALLKMTRDFKK